MYRVIIADDEPLIRAGLYYRNDWNAIAVNGQVGWVSGKYSKVV